MRASVSANAAVYAALAANILIAVTKFGAAGWTGSSAMVSEGVHSLVDAGNEVLLLYGLRRAGRDPDRAHPLGYGRELYLWTFIVALLIFALGGGVAMYQGVLHVISPEPIRNATANYVVLGVSALIEGGSWWVGLRAFLATKGERSVMQAVVESKNPVTFTILFEDSADLLGIAIAAAGIGLASASDMPVFDGFASILIGAMLGAMAFVLARESKALLIGEAADPAIRTSILAIASRDPAVDQANEIVTVHLGPEQIVAGLSLDFADDLRAPEIEACVARLEDAIRAAHPEVTTLFVKPQTASVYRERRAALGDGGRT